MSTCAVVRSFIESKTTEVQTSNVGFTSEVSDYLVVHTGPGLCGGPEPSGTGSPPALESQELSNNNHDDNNDNNNDDDDNDDDNNDTIITIMITMMRMMIIMIQ